MVTDIASQAGAATLRNCPVTATMMATGCNQQVLKLAREATEDSAADEILGFTLIDELLVGRYLGHSTENARNLFVNTWKAIRPSILGRHAVPPRIWAT